MKKFKKKFLLNQIFKQEKSVKTSKFSFPLLNNGYSKNDLMEGAKTLISGKLTMGEKTKKFENYFKFEEVIL